MTEATQHPASPAPPATHNDPRPPTTMWDYSPHEQAAYDMITGYRTRAGIPLLAERLEQLRVLDRRTGLLKTAWLADPDTAAAQLADLGPLPKSAWAMFEAACRVLAAIRTEYVLEDRNSAAYAAALWRLADAFDRRRVCRCGHPV